VRIKTVLETIKDRELPLIKEDKTIKEVLEKMLQYPHTRLVYVIDKNGFYKGTISLERLVTHLFPYCFEPDIVPRSLIPVITAKSAKDIMNKGLVYATKEDTVDEVIHRMIRADSNEIAVLNDKKKVVADVTMLDLLKYCHLDRVNFI
jgi:CBS domain-containing protein